MERKLLLTYCLLLAIGLLTTVQAQQTFKTTKKSVIGYLEYLPKDYHSTTKKYGVLIFLHGVGERGPASKDPKVLATKIKLLSKLGPPKMINEGAQFPYIVITPQLKSNYKTWDVWYMMEVLDHIKSTLRIDENRIYLTGLSLGGAGTWNWAQERPDIFAAIAPVCGGWNSTSKAKGIADRDVAVWAFHGDKDNVVPLSVSARMVNAINSYNPTPKAKLSVYAGVRHDAWVRAYRTDHGVHNPNLYEWFAKQKRGGGSSSDEEEEAPANQAPVVSAGADLSLPANTKKVELKAEASDKDGKIAKYKWDQLTGKTTKMEGTSTATLLVSDLVAGSYAFRVTVTDDDGSSKSDDVKVNVSAASNELPTVSAGNDITITTKTTSVEIKGTASDSDGSIKKYQWSQIAGEALKIDGAQTNVLKLSGYKEGTYSFRLTVTDDKGATKSDDMNLVVKKEVVENKIPVVSAGNDITITTKTTSVEFKGTASDSDGSIKKYQWSQIAGEALKIEGAQTNVLKLSGYKEGTYSFRLTVTDDKNATKSDDVNLVVNKEVAENKIPVVSAGDDITITTKTTFVEFKGSASDPDGSIKKYQWSQLSGGTVKLEGAQSNTLKVSGYKEGTYTFRLTATDDKGATKYDETKLVVNKEAVANKAPVVSAGTDLVVNSSVTSVQLAGTASDPDGSVKQYQWSQRSGAAVNLSGEQSPTLVVSGLKEGTFAFRLTATDDKGATSYDEVNVQVNPEPEEDALIAYAGPDRQKRLPVSTYRVSGGADSPYKITSYEWKQVSGAPLKMTDANKRTMVLSGITTVGARTFQLTAHDAKGRSATDLITINFIASLKSSSDEPMEPMAYDPTQELPAEEPETGAGESRLSDWNDKFVNIYNDRGQQIYSGKWNEDSPEEAFRHPGLYIYHVKTEGKKTKTGKLIIR